MAQKKAPASHCTTFLVQQQSLYPRVSESLQAGTSFSGWCKPMEIYSLDMPVMMCLLGCSLLHFLPGRVGCLAPERDAAIQPIKGNWQHHCIQLSMTLSAVCLSVVWFWVSLFCHTLSWVQSKLQGFAMVIHLQWETLVHERDAV